MGFAGLKYGFCGAGVWEHTLSSASSGRCSRISMGAVSAAMTTNSEMPRFSVLVAAPGTAHVSAQVERIIPAHGTGLLHRFHQWMWFPEFQNVA